VNLTWEQKIMRMKELGEPALHMLEPFDWKVNQPNVLIVDLKSRDDHLAPEGRGHTPYEAINNHWEQLTHKFPILIVVDPDEGPRAVTWNGQNWMDVPGFDAF
jgi:hypothetical protein